MHIIRLTDEPKELSYEEYLNALLKLKNENEIYILNHLINANKEILNIDISGIEAALDMLFKRRLAVYIKSNWPKPKEIKLFCRKYNREIINYSLSLEELEELLKNDIACYKAFLLEYVKSQIFSEDKSLVIDNPEQVKSFAMPSYKHFNTLREGQFFGSYDLDDNCPDAAAYKIIAAEDTHLGLINKNIYDQYILAEKNKLKEQHLNFLFSLTFNNFLNKAKFEREYFDQFIFQEYFKDEVLVKENQQCEYVYFIYEGALILNCSKTYSAVDADISKLLAFHPLVKNEAFPDKDFLAILKAFDTNSKPLDKILLQELNKKKKITIKKIEKKEILGLENIYFNSPSFFTAIVNSNKLSCFKIEAQTLKKMLKWEATCAETFLNFSIKKFGALLNRFYYIKKSFIEMARHKYKGQAENSGASHINGSNACFSDYFNCCNNNNNDNKNSINNFKNNLNSNNFSNLQSYPHKRHANSLQRISSSRNRANTNWLSPAQWLTSFPELSSVANKRLDSVIYLNRNFMDSPETKLMRNKKSKALLDTNDYLEISHCNLESDYEADNANQASKEKINSKKLQVLVNTGKSNNSNSKNSIVNINNNINNHINDNIRTNSRQSANHNTINNNTGNSNSNSQNFTKVSSFLKESKNASSINYQLKSLISSDFLPDANYNEDFNKNKYIIQISKSKETINEPYTNPNAFIETKNNYFNSSNNNNNNNSNDESNKDDKKHSDFNKLLQVKNKNNLIFKMQENKLLKPIPGNNEQKQNFLILNCLSQKDAGNSNYSNSDHSFEIDNSEIFKTKKSRKNTYEEAKKEARDLQLQPISKEKGATQLIYSKPRSINILRSKSKKQLSLKCYTHKEAIEANESCLSKLNSNFIDNSKSKLIEKNDSKSDHVIKTYNDKTNTKSLFTNTQKISKILNINSSHKSTGFSISKNNIEPNSANNELYYTQIINSENHIISSKVAQKQDLIFNNKSFNEKAFEADSLLTFEKTPNLIKNSGSKCDNNNNINNNKSTNIIVVNNKSKEKINTIIKPQDDYMTRKSYFFSLQNTLANEKSNNTNTIVNNYNTRTNEPEKLAFMSKGASLLSCVNQKINAKSFNVKDNLNAFINANDNATDKATANLSTIISNKKLIIAAQYLNKSIKKSKVFKLKNLETLHSYLERIENKKTYENVTNIGNNSNNSNNASKSRNKIPENFKAKKPNLLEDKTLGLGQISQIPIFDFFNEEANGNIVENNEDNNKNFYPKNRLSIKNLFIQKFKNQNFKKLINEKRQSSENQTNTKRLSYIDLSNYENFNMDIMEKFKNNKLYEKVVTEYSMLLPKNKRGSTIDESAHVFHSLQDHSCLDNNNKNNNNFINSQDYLVGQNTNNSKDVFKNKKHLLSGLRNPLQLKKLHIKKLKN